MAEDIAMTRGWEERTDLAMRTLAESSSAFSKGAGELEASLRALERTYREQEKQTEELCKTLLAASEQVRKMQKSYRELGEAFGIDVVAEEQKSPQQGGEAGHGIAEKAESGMDTKTEPATTAVKELQSKQAAGKLAQLFFGSIAEMGTAAAYSAWGNEGGTMFGSTVSGIASGAAIGQMLLPVPILGALVGAGVGGLAGLLSGGTKIFTKKDDAFKDYVQGSVEGQLEDQMSSIRRGSILAAAQESAAAEDQSKTFAGRSAELERQAGEMDLAYGEGYNEMRQKGMEEQIEWFENGGGAMQEEANRAIGAWRASLENQAEAYEREALDAVMGGNKSIDGLYADSKQKERLTALATEYEGKKDLYEKAQKALQGALSDEERVAAEKVMEDAGAEMGKILAETKIIAQNEYNASEGAQQLLEMELSLADTVREDTASNEAYWNAGYRKGQEYSKGLLAGTRYTEEQIEGFWQQARTAEGRGELDLFDPDHMGVTELREYIRQTYPDNTAETLHPQKETESTAAAPGSSPNGGNVQITLGGSYYVRTEADIPKIAGELAREIRAAQTGGML